MTQGVQFCGQEVTPAQLRLIIDCVQRFPALSREELANTLCEWLGWIRPNGGLNARECRDFLHSLHEQSIIKLPVLRAGRPLGSSTAIPYTPLGDPDQPLHCTLSQVQPIQIRRIKVSAEHKLWRELVGRYHYLGYRTPYGASMRYLIETASKQSRILGCLQFSSPAWQMKARGDWIGWDKARRQHHLSRLISNIRFLILPWVTIPNLASHVLAMALRIVTKDWETHYGIQPWLVEPLVDSQRVSGHSNRAANWIDVGQTTGRGRQDKEHLRHGAAPKRILLYPLRPNARKYLQTDRLSN
jgi:hypothetical protein